MPPESSFVRLWKIRGSGAEPRRRVSALLLVLLSAGAPITAASVSSLGAGVSVEPDNSSFALAGDAVTYSHEITNTGGAVDAFEISSLGTLGYAVELLNPINGSVIALDADGDGSWDGAVTVNTGGLPPGGSVFYDLRVTVPGSAVSGDKESTRLIATSNLDPGLSGEAIDETLVVDPADIGPVVLVPNQSGYIGPGGSVVYTHRLFNNSGTSDTFDLVLSGTLPSWGSAAYEDSDADGLYTPGIDLPITEIQNLSDGDVRTFFVSVDVSADASPGEADMTTITASSRSSPPLAGTALDITTVILATTHELSGGGTELVEGGDNAIFPGHLQNLLEQGETFNFTLSASPINDAFLHPTQLMLDNDGDGTPETLIAEDANGSGLWSFVDPAHDSDADGNPDVVLAGLSSVAYELRRAVDPGQTPYRDPVTFTATASSTGEVDKVTAVNLLPAPTDALMAGVELFATADGVLVEWQTALEIGTAGFHVERFEADGGVVRLNEETLTGLLHSPMGGLYRWLDTDPLEVRETATYQLVVVDVGGAERVFGPFSAETLEEAASPEEPAHFHRNAPAHRFTAQAREPVLRTGGGRAQAQRNTAQSKSGFSGRLRVRVMETGLYTVTAAEMATAWGEDVPTISALIATGGLRLFQQEAPAMEPECIVPDPGMVLRTVICAPGASPPILPKVCPIGRPKTVVRSTSSARRSSPSTPKKTSIGWRKGSARA